MSAYVADKKEDKDKQNPKSIIRVAIPLDCLMTNPEEAALSVKFEMAKQLLIKKGEENIQQAIKLLNELVDAKFHQAYIVLGRIYEKVNKQKEAVKIFKRGIRDFECPGCKGRYAHYLLFIKKNASAQQKALAIKFLNESLGSGLWYEAAVHLGLCYKKGVENGVLKKDIGKAITHFELARQHPDICLPDSYTYAAYELSVIYDSEEYVEKPDPKKAREFSKLAAEEGHTISILLYAGRLINGEGGPRDLKEAERLLKEIGNSEDIDINGNAKYFLGLIYEARQAEHPDNANKAFDYFKQAEVSGQEYAILKVAQCYLAQKGDENEVITRLNKLLETKDVELKLDVTVLLAKHYMAKEDSAESIQQGLALYEKAAEMGCSDSIEFLKQYYREHATDLKKGKEYLQQYFRCLEKTALKGNLNDCYLLGLALFEGVQTQQNLSRSFDFFTRAKDLPDGSGNNALGFCHLNGHGTPVDYKAAVAQFRESVKKGSTEGEFNYATCLLYGLGTKPNVNEAIQIFEKLKDKIPLAKICLGWCALNGLGKSVDLPVAIQLLCSTPHQENKSQQEPQHQITFQKAMEFLEKIIATQPKQSARLAFCYLMGLGVQPNINKSAELFLKVFQQSKEAFKEILNFLKHPGVDRELKQKWIAQCKLLMNHVDSNLKSKSEQKSESDSKSKSETKSETKQAIERKDDKEAKLTQELRGTMAEALAHCYFEGMGVDLKQENDRVEAFNLLKTAVLALGEKGVLPKTHQFLSRCYAEGIGTKANVKEYYQSLQPLARLKQSDACRILGERHLAGDPENGVPYDLKTALEYLKQIVKSQKNGQSHSHSSRNGNGRKSDPKKSEQRKSDLQELKDIISELEKNDKVKQHPIALLNLAKAVLNQELNLAKDPGAIPLVYKLLMKLAKLEHLSLPFQNHVGWVLLNAGKVTEARDLFKALAKKGSYAARLNDAWCELRNADMPADYSKIADLFKQINLIAKDKKLQEEDICFANFWKVNPISPTLLQDTKLCFCLAQCYLNGWGVKPDLKTAEMLCNGLLETHMKTEKPEKEVIETAILVAQYKESGMCFQKDVQRAIQLYQWAASHGEARSIARMQRFAKLEKKVDPKDTAKPVENSPPVNAMPQAQIGQNGIPQGAIALQPQIAQQIEQGYGQVVQSFQNAEFNGFNGEVQAAQPAQALTWQLQTQMQQTVHLQAGQNQVQVNNGLPPLQNLQTTQFRRSRTE